MFGFRRKKDKKYAVYDGIRLLYLNQPADETVCIKIDRENKMLELYWDGTLYVMSMDRLAVSYYDDIYSAFLARGKQVFADDWPVMESLLLREKEKREQENALKNRDGLRLTYQTKENGKLTCLLTSEVFLYMANLMKDLKAYIGDKNYEKIEL